MLEVLKNDVVKVVKIVAFDIKSVASTVSKEIKSFVVDLPVYLDFKIRLNGYGIKFTVTVRNYKASNFLILDAKNFIAFKVSCIYQNIYAIWLLTITEFNSIIAKELTGSFTISPA